MVTDEKQQILNCNILFYFKSIEQTITFKLCFITQFKCNALKKKFLCHSLRRARKLKENNHLTVISLKFERTRYKKIKGMNSL